MDHDLLVRLNASFADRNQPIPPEQTALIATACLRTVTEIPENELEQVFGDLGIVHRLGEFPKRVEIVARINYIRDENQHCDQGLARRMINCILRAEKFIPLSQSDGVMGPLAQVDQLRR